MITRFLFKCRRCGNVFSPHFDGQVSEAEVFLMQITTHDCVDAATTDQAKGIGDIIGYNLSDDEGV